MKAFITVVSITSLLNTLSISFIESKLFNGSPLETCIFAYQILGTMNSVIKKARAETQYYMIIMGFSQ